MGKRIKSSEEFGKTSFRFPKSLLKRFRLYCVGRELEQSDAIVLAVTDFLARQEKSVPVPDPEQNATTPIEQGVMKDTLARLEGTSTWVDAMLRLLESGVGVDQFRQLTAIFQSRDTEVIAAISSNLTVFGRVEAVRTALSERPDTAVPEEGDDFSARVQEAVSRASKTLRNAQRTIDDIAGSGGSDTGSGQKSG